MKRENVPEVWHNDEELTNIIKEYYPEGTNAEHNLMKYAIALESVGSSFKEVLEKMVVPGSPFLKIPSRD